MLIYDVRVHLICLGDQMNTKNILVPTSDRPVEPGTTIGRLHDQLTLVLLLARVPIVAPPRVQ